MVEPAAPADAHADPRERSTADRAEAALVGSDRVLAVLTQLALRPNGAGLDELARALESPKPTIHRALAALRRAGFASRDSHGHYELGNEFIRLAFLNHEARPEHQRIEPVLEELAERYGETAHYAVLDGRSVVYRAKVGPSTGAVKLSSTVGGRNPAHSTAVGKLLLAHRLRDDAAVTEWVRTGELRAKTDQTRVTAAELCEEFELIRQRGFATDDQENEYGISCLALPVFLTSQTVPTGAVSISALIYRTPLANLVDEVAAIRAVVERRVRTRQP